MKPKSASSEPPLVTEEREETDPVTGGNVKVTRYERGLLTFETRTYEVPHGGLFGTTTSREDLEEFCDYLRDQLAKHDLPSDRTPVWVKIADREWEPLTEANRPSRPPFAYARWTKRIQDLTEPLTIERAAAELLFASTMLLQRENVDDHLWYILRLAKSYSDYRLLARYNGLAHQGVVARRGRREGPRTRQRRCSQTRDIIRRHAEEYWRDHPAYRGQASNTAATIAKDVNDELRLKHLLPKGKEQLSVKTISDHIRNGTC